MPRGPSPIPANPDFSRMPLKELRSPILRAAVDLALGNNVHLHAGLLKLSDQMGEPKNLLQHVYVGTRNLSEAQRDTLLEIVRTKVRGDRLSSLAAEKLDECRILLKPPEEALNAWRAKRSWEPAGSDVPNAESLPAPPPSATTAEANRPEPITASFETYTTGLPAGSPGHNLIGVTCKLLPGSKAWAVVDEAGVMHVTVLPPTPKLDEGREIEIPSRE